MVDDSNHQLTTEETLAEEFLAETSFTSEQWDAYCRGLDQEYEKCYRCALFRTYQGDQGQFDACKLFGTPEPLLCHDGPFVTEESVKRAG